MFIRILTFVLLLTCCGRAAQAGVMGSHNWDSASSIATLDNDTLPQEQVLVGLDKGSPSSMSVSASGHSTTFTAFYSAIGPIAFGSDLIGCIRLSDRSLPPAPVLDDRLKPA